MKQRLAIARCISHQPKILLLDEPINGLDPVAIKDIRELFISLKNNGATIVLSSHILSEILQTAESIVVLSSGNLQNLDSIDALSFIGLIGNVTGLITKPIDIHSVMNVLLLTIILAFIANSISTISLRVGFF